MSGRANDRGPQQQVPRDMKEYPGRDEEEMAREGGVCASILGNLTSV